MKVTDREHETDGHEGMDDNACWCTGSAHRFTGRGRVCELAPTTEREAEKKRQYLAATATAEP